MIMLPRNLRHLPVLSRLVRCTWWPVPSGFAALLLLGCVTPAMPPAGPFWQPGTLATMPQGLAVSPLEGMTQGDTQAETLPPPPEPNLLPPPETARPLQPQAVVDGDAAPLSSGVSAPAPNRSGRVYKLDYYATTFAAGPCRFGSCNTDGWTVTDSDGRSSETRCRFGHCAVDGWSTTHADGRTSETRCHFNDCWKDGWQTTHPDGRASETRCRFNDCWKDGWTTQYPDGSVSETRCNFSACMTDGWSTSLPSGTTIQCRCKFGDCRVNGADCQ